MERAYVQGLFFVLASLIIQTRCDCVVRDYKPICSRVEDLLHYVFIDWTALDIIGDGPHQTIQQSSVRGIKDIRRLKIKNAVNIIETSSFRKLNNLKELILEDNQIHSFDFGVIGNTNIRKAYMRNNTIEHLTFPFWNIDNLKEFGLEYEKLDTIHNGMFNLMPLEILSLKMNKISEIKRSAFLNMKSLKKLYLCGNYINDFDSQKIFGDSSNLEELYMNYNFIHTLTPDMFTSLSYLRVLFLGGNRIRIIHHDSFIYLPKLKELSLSANQITTIEPKTFPTTLKKLNLSFNRFTYIPFNQLDYFIRLDEISIVGNPLQCVCWRLVKFWLIRNDIKQIDCSNDSFKTGRLPKCYVHDKRYCIENPNFQEKIFKEFSSALNEYDDIPECLFSQLKKTRESYFSYSGF